LIEEFVYYEKWIEHNFNSSMNYLGKNADKRKSVRNILNSAKTVIATAFNYYTNSENIPENSNFGKISRYSQVKDYHVVIKNNLKLLSDKIIQLKPDTENLIYVDTGPVLEKQWAVRAGIGWQGKNGLIITKEFGSYIFLGIIITSLEIEPDKPAKEHCGNCKKCIDACPTKAIIKPKVIDANKCIAYWTIETKPETDFPDFIKQNNPGWVYGCDICQEVCPWNSKVKETSITEFNTHKLPAFINCKEIEKMTKEEFNQIFGNSPVKRLGLDGIKRNCLML
jgi:epoxyqueuosine reductase